MLLGGEFLVRGAVALAHRLGVSPLLIGLTLVEAVGCLGLKPAPCGVIENPTQPAKPQAVEIDRQTEDLWKAFDAIGTQHQLRFIHDACLRLGLDPLLMAPPAAFRLVDEEPERAVDLPAEDAPATDDAPMDPQAEPPASFGLVNEEPEVALDLPAEVAPAIDDDAVVSKAEQQHHAADSGGRDAQDAGDEPPAVFGLADENCEVTPATDDAAVAHAKQGDDGADLDAHNLTGAGDDLSEAARRGARRRDEVRLLQCRRREQRTVEDDSRPAVSSPRLRCTR